MTDAVHTLLSVLADMVAARLKGANDAEADWVSQHGSPLGPRKHCAIVRQFIAAGQTDRAQIKGKRKLLRRDAFEAELLRLKAGKAPSPEPTPAGPRKTAPDEDRESKWDRRLRVAK